LHVLLANFYSIVSIEIFCVKNANPSFYAKHVENSYFLLPSKFKMNRSCDKLKFGHLRSFLVIKQINDVAFCLKLSPSMKIHQIFHIFLLKPYKESAKLGRFHIPPPPIEI
jgi:hypothetical protein